MIILGIIAAVILTLWQPRLMFAVLKIAILLAIAVSFGFIGIVLLASWIGGGSKGKQ